MKSLLAKSNAAKARVASIKERGGVLAVLKTEGGAIDLASIMVGVLVIGIIGGVIAATVFAVIPWSQDNAAKQALDSVKSAESVQYSFSSGDGSAAYGTDAFLEGTANAASKSLLQTSTSIKIVVSNDGQHFVALSASATGVLFYSTDDGKAPTTTAPTIVVDVTATPAAGSYAAALPTKFVGGVWS
jgi:type II secretory pathway pseudopilin PulG